MKEKLLIGIGSEIGTRHCPEVITNFQRALNKRAFEEGSSHFKSLNGLHIALRISGEIKSYNDEKPSKPRRMRNKPYVTTEWVLQQRDWHNKSVSELKEVLWEGINVKFTSLMDFVRPLGETINEEQTLKTFDSLVSLALSES